MENEVPSFTVLWTWGKSARLRRLGIGLIRDICSYLPSTSVWAAWVIMDKVYCCDFKDTLVKLEAALSESVNETGARWMTISSSRIVLCGGNSRKA